MSRIVAIVGRPNVGKSTLFNRFTESRKAIVDDVSGVTRDRHYGTAEWNGKEFTIIDTGGYVPDSQDVFEKAIREQVLMAIEESDILLFMVDVTCGITDLDADFGRLMRQSKKPVYLIANKVDNNERIYDIAEFYKLGLGDLFAVSSMSGSGTGELLDKIVSNFTDEDQYNPGLLDVPKFAVVGKPNVGKSTLINALLGVERTIVTPIAGTTRDTIHTLYNYFGKSFYLIDTAGLRKKGKVNENIEFYSVLRTIKAVEDCDVCLLMIDVQDGIGSQDLNIFHLAQSRGKGIVILVNKWDLIEKETNTVRDFEKEIKEKIAPFNDIDIIFISSENKQRIFKAIETAQQVFENLSRKIKTSVLNDVMLEIIDRTPPPSMKGKYINIKYATQVKESPPVFTFFANLPQYVREPYKRFLENQMRKNFVFTGVPIKIFFRKK